MYEDTVDETHDDIFHVNVLGENDTKIVDAGSAQVSWMLTFEKKI